MKIKRKFGKRDIRTIAKKLEDKAHDLFDPLIEKETDPKKKLYLEVYRDMEIIKALKEVLNVLEEKDKERPDKECQLSE